MKINHVANNPVSPYIGWPVNEKLPLWSNVLDPSNVATNVNWYVEFVTSTIGQIREVTADESWSEHTISTLTIFCCLTVRL